MDGHTTRLIAQQNHASASMLLREMYRDRKRVFVDMLKWDIPHEAELERDRYDAGPAEYLILHDPSRGEHVASLRLLRTDLPHLMSDTFDDLCVGGAPSDLHIREITRLCVAPRGNAADRRLARNRLVRSMVEYGLLTGIRSFTAVCEMRFLSEVLSAGWDCRPLGLPKVVDGRPVGALRIDIDPSTLARLNENWSCDPVPLQYFETDPALAA